MRSSSVLLCRVLVSLCLLFGAAGCRSGNCGDGDYCECDHVGGQCYLDCGGSGCSQVCHDTDECGAVCDDDCTFDCHSSPRCSDSCGDGCAMACRDSNECGMLCGAGCNFSCVSAGKCGARVGPGSQVLCQDVGSCVIDCSGDCRVTCVQVGAPCQVRCRNGADATNCGGGVFACGPC